jgi:hypothetical protein
MGTIEFCHDVRPFLQPHPSKNPGGDCFACALTSILQYLFPDNPPVFETVWNYFMCDYHKSNEKGLNNTWLGMEKAINEASHDKYSIDHEYDLVLPRYDWASFSYAFYPRLPAEKDYTRRLEGWLRSGWIAITEVNMYGAGIYNDKGQFNDTDHYIVLDGTRESRESTDDDSSTLNFYIHVVCSVNGAYWIRSRELMKKYGAAGWWLIRKRNI